MIVSRRRAAGPRRPAPKPPRRPSNYDKIYRVVRRIPRGRVTTYGEVARLAGLPGHARLVGYALHAAPSGARLPWHRVVNAQGRLSLGRGTDGGDLPQRFRLEREGVAFDPNGRIRLATYGWPGRKRVRPATRGVTGRGDRDRRDR